MRMASGELGEIIRQRAAHFARENFVHGRDGPGALINFHTFDAVHWEENSRYANASAVGFIDLTDEMVEGVEVDAFYRDARGSNAKQNAPKFFFWCVQAYDHDGMKIHRAPKARIA